VLAVLET
jgi:hypothetical protein